MNIYSITHKGFFFLLCGRCGNMLKSIANIKYNHDSLLEECLICKGSKSSSQVIKVKCD